MDSEIDRQDQLREVDKALAVWRQGDCHLGETWFVFGTNASLLPTQVAKETTSEGMELIEAQVRGFVVLTQTCDIVRPYQQRPYRSRVPGK